MNDRATRVRKAVTFPFSTFVSIFTTSATRKSRIEVAAVSTAFRPASSQEAAEALDTYASHATQSRAFAFALPEMFPPLGISVEHSVAQLKHEPGPPMDLANMRRQGVRNLIAFCLNDSCRHQEIIDVSSYPGDTPVPCFRSKVQCGKCGARSNRIDVRPNWIGAGGR